VIINTPKKWDSVTRRSTKRLAVLTQILLDEVHVLGGVDSGCCLEVVINCGKEKCA
jgi:replicative superfamily II helicase